MSHPAGPAAARVDRGWLALRGPADAAARSPAAVPLAAQLTRHLRQRLDRSGRPASLVDVGAGTGAGAAWLRGLLPLRQDWRLLDSDAELLAAAGPVREGWARPIVADVTALGTLLAAEPADVVTCQALLDLFTAGQVDAMLEPAIAARSAVLLGLTVTGEVQISPPDPDDAAVSAHFNAHQRRSGRLGPDAAARAATVLRGHGYVVTGVPTPWRLDGCALATRWLDGRAAAAAEQSPRDGALVRLWLHRRLNAVRSGDFAATVGHLDVLGVPPPG